jgi:predicted phosphodiesterase
MALQKHKQEKEWLKIVLEQNTAKKVVVVTHFLPSYQLVHERWKNSSNDTLNYYFSAGCDELINPKYVDAWIFGHTHDRRDTTINNVPMYCNPLGYAGKNRFQEMIVEI